MDKLDEIYEMQMKFNSKGGGPSERQHSRYPSDMGGRISAVCTAMIHEAVELQRLTNWKWWKRPAEFDVPAAREELIDVMHFVIQAAIELGMNPSDILAEYRKKHEINMERDRNGY